MVSPLSESLGSEITLQDTVNWRVFCGPQGAVGANSVLSLGLQTRLKGICFEVNAIQHFPLCYFVVFLFFVGLFLELINGI